MNAVVQSISPAKVGPQLEIGRSGVWFDKPLKIDLERLLSGRMLIQGSSGAGKSWLVRKIVEEAFEYATTMIVDPEGEFENLAQHIGATTIKGVEIATDGLTAAAVRARHHRLPLHLDLTDLSPDERVLKAAAFFAGLLSSPREDWTNTVLVAIDEAHLLAPSVAASARDREARQLGVATLTELCSRGRKRGIAPILATQRLAKLAASVTSELHNSMIGLSVFDRDIDRAADRLGFDSSRAEELRDLAPGTFYAIGPAISRTTIIGKVGDTATRHIGAAPELVGPADADQDKASELLQLEALKDTGHAPRDAMTGQRNRGALDTFLIDPAAPAAVRIVDALRAIAPNATSATELERHLGLPVSDVHNGLDLLSLLGAVDTMPRGETRIARLSARLRLRGADTKVVGLS